MQPPTLLPVALHHGEALRVHITERSARLGVIAKELKEELFGIDDVIDRVIESVRAWYVLPELINRPVIVCLWGLTGTGKTQLTRSLAQKMNFYSRFVEVQMDGFSNDGGQRSSTISGMLADTITQGEPGILVLDEWQRYRTVDAQGKDVRVERYMDVWTLLSDGIIAPAISFMENLHMELASAEYHEDRHRSRTPGSRYLFSGDADDDEEVSDGQDGVAQEDGSGGTGHSTATRPPRRFSLSPYESKELKSSLKLKEPLTEIMTWSRATVMQQLQAFCDNPAMWETDYSRLLIFVCGNLDEMYAELASRVEDCDSDADVFHAMTSRLSVIDVKRALASRFKPEQIARLGNTHIVYPSFARSTFEKLVQVTADRYVKDVERTSGLRFQLSDGLLEQLYVNGVFSLQGTRPLFSSIHSILSGALVNFTLWALEQGAQAGDGVWLDVQLTEQAVDSTLEYSQIDPATEGAPAFKVQNTAALVASYGGYTRRLPILLEILQLQERRDPDYKALLAVHEAGHAVVYTALFGRAPVELKIHVASHPGGYNTLAGRKATTRADMRDAICVDLAGRAAELVVFGAEHVTSGGLGDLTQATQRAAEYVRFLGFDGRISRTDLQSDESDSVNTDMAPTNVAIEKLLKLQSRRARDILKRHRVELLTIAQALQARGAVEPQEILQWMGLNAQQQGIAPFASMLDHYRLDISG